MKIGVRYIFWSFPFLLAGGVFYWYALQQPSHDWQIQKSQKTGNEATFFFADLDEDGTVEKIYLSNPEYNKGEPSVYIYSEDDRFLDLWTLEEPLLIGNTYLIEDFNEDNKKEFYCFTQTHDSLFMYGMDPQYGERFFIKRRFFISPSAFNLTLSLSIKPIGAYDVTQDGFKELLFALIDTEQELTHIVQYDYINNSFILSEPIPGTLLQAHKAPPGDNLFYYLSIDYSARSASSNVIMGMGKDLSFHYTPVQAPVSKVWFFTNPSAYGALRMQQLMDPVAYSLDRFNEQEVDRVLRERGEIKKVVIAESLLYLFDEHSVSAFDVKSFEKVYTRNNLAVEKVTLLKSSNRCYFLVHSQTGVALFSDKLRLISHEKTPPGKVIEAHLLSGMQNALPDIAFEVDNQLLQVALIPISWVKQRWLWTLLIAFGGFGGFLLFRYVTLLVLHQKKLKSTLGGEYAKVLRTKDQYKLVKRLPLTHFVNDNPSVVSTASTEEDAFTAPFISYFNELMEDLTSKPLHINYHLFPHNHWHDVRDGNARNILESIKFSTDAFQDWFYSGKTNLQLLRDDESVQVYIDFKPLEVNTTRTTHTFKEDLKQKLDALSPEVMVDITVEGRVIVAVSFQLQQPDAPLIDSSRKLRVLLAEDHDVTLYGLMSLFKSNNDMEVVATAKDGYEVLSKMKETVPDVVVTDVAMPEMDGIELTARLRKEFPHVQIVVFTMYMENWFVERLLRNGVKAMVSKSSSIHELVHAIQASVSKSSYFCPRFREKFGLEIQLTDEGVKRITKQLSITEFHVLHLLKNKGSKTTLSDELGLKMEMVDRLLANLMLKLNASDLEELQRIARHLDICLPENLN
ncbi:MAG: response regulator [Bacteroidota bacterium]